MKELITYSNVMVVTEFIHVIKFMELYTPKIDCLYITLLNKLVSVLHIVKEIIILPGMVSAS